MKNNELVVCHIVVTLNDWLTHLGITLSKTTPLSTPPTTNYQHILSAHHTFELHYQSTQSRLTDSQFIDDLFIIISSLNSDIESYAFDLSRWNMKSRFQVSSRDWICLGRFRSHRALGNKTEWSITDQYSTSDENCFAYISLRERWPNIIVQLLL